MTKNKVVIKTVLPKTLDLVDKIAKTDENKLIKKALEKIEKLPDSKQKEVLRELALKTKGRFKARLKVGEAVFTYDYMQYCTDAYKLKCLIKDLSHKKYFVDKSVELFYESLSRLKSDFKEHQNIDFAKLMDCYLFFESFLFQSRALLDLLARFYAEIFHNEFRKLKVPSRSFNKFRKWVLEKAKSLEFYDEFVNFFETQTSWFNLLKAYRDEFAHHQGYNPLIEETKNGDIKLRFCTVYMLKYDLDLEEIVRRIHQGIEQLLKFTDDFLSKYIKNYIS